MEHGPGAISGQARRGVVKTDWLALSQSRSIPVRGEFSYTPFSTPRLWALPTDSCVLHFEVTVLLTWAGFGHCKSSGYSDKETVMSQWLQWDTLYDMLHTHTWMLVYEQCCKSLSMRRLLLRVKTCDVHVDGSRWWYQRDLLTIPWVD